MKDEQLSLEMAPAAVKFRSYEEESYFQGFKTIAGVDEAGRGPLAGPVIAAAVISTIVIWRLRETAFDELR